MAKRKETESTTKKKVATSKSKDLVVEITKEDVTGLVVSAKPVKPLVWDTNIPEIRKTIQEKLLRYAGMKVTDENFNQCDLVRKCCVSLRNSVENSRKNAKAQYIKLPADTLDAMYAELLKDIEKVELPLKEQFDVYAEEEREELRSIVQEYIDQYQEEYQLEDKFLAMVELKDKYLNKTQKDADTRESLKEQFEEAKEEQEAYYSDVNLIRATVGEDKRFNADLLVAQLEHRQVSVIVTEILNEKKRLDECEKEGKPLSVGENNETVIAAVEGSSKGSGKGSKPMKTVRCELTYPAEASQRIKDFFNSNKDIKVKFIK